jgi:hypothetical protein
MSPPAPSTAPERGDRVAIGRKRDVVYFASNAIQRMEEHAIAHAIDQQVGRSEAFAADREQLTIR